MFTITNWFSGEPNSAGDEDNVEVHVAILKMNDVHADSEGKHPVCVKPTTTE